MVVFERHLMKIIRYRKVFFPTSEQLADLTHDLAPSGLVRVFFDPAQSAIKTCPVLRGRGETTVVDLSKGEDAIYAGMHANCRYKMRRAEKMGERVQIAMNTDSARLDLLALYNGFARNKSGVPLLKAKRFAEYLPHADIFALYFDGEPWCVRLVLRDEEAGRALMLYSGTRRLKKGTDTITCGLLNRYLHWHEMKIYQAAGMEKYDFGGIGPKNPPLTQFKLSFGGKLVMFDYALYAGAAWLSWRIANSLYNAWMGLNFVERY